MKRFLFLIVPSHSFEDLISSPDTVSIWNEVVPPYGVLSIISYVYANRDISVEFKITDLRLLVRKSLLSGLDREEIEKEVISIIGEFSPDFIGLSAIFSTCYSNTNWVIDAITSSCTDAVVIAGGALATVGYARLLSQFPRIDLCVIAEGELPLASMLRDNEPLSAWKRNSAIVTRESIENEIVPQPELIEDLDSIPPIDLSLIECEEHRRGQMQIDLLTSRGCPFRCVFCASHLMNGNRVRFYTVERVCRDLEKYVDDGFRDIRFFDDNFFYEANRAKKILNKIISFDLPDLKISFPAGVMVRRIDEEIAGILKAAGVASMPLAVESGSEYVLRNLMHKPVNRKDVIRSVRALKKHDIDTHIFIVVGIPGETDEHRLETMEYVKGLDVDWATINIAIPLKGSELYEICKEKGLLYEYSEFDFKTRRCFIKTPDYSPEYIEYVAYKMNLELNFISNSNLRNENFKKALRYFDDIITKYPTHAFAYYCASRCCEGLKDDLKARLLYEKFNEIIKADVFWEKYAVEFGLLSTAK